MEHIVCYQWKVTDMNGNLMKYLFINDSITNHIAGIGFIAYVIAAWKIKKPLTYYTPKSIRIKQDNQ